MRIATKLNAGILLVFATGVLANYVALQATVKPKFDEIEAASALVNHKRVTDAIESLCGKVRAASQDWAMWDDAYDFAKGKNSKAFKAANLTPAANTMEGLGVNVLVFRTLAGAVTWGEAYDLATKSPIAGLAQEMSKLSYRHPFLDGGSDPMARTGLMRSGSGLMLVAVTPILKSDRSGPAVGTLMVGNILDEKAVRTLTGVDFTLEPVPARGTELTATPVSKTLDSKVETSSLVSDINGQPLVVLKAATPRDVGKAGAAAIKSAILMMMGAAAAAILALWLFVNLIVVSRIAALKDHFASAGDTGRIRQTRTDTSDDEIGQLSRSFDDMANQVNHLRDALADSAYLSGISEWASGTLHNVRNGLSPVGTLTWQIRELFEPVWMRNLKTAVDECKSAGTPPERRAKLETYVLSSASRFLETAEKAKQLSGRIDDTSKAVVEIVSQFEEHSRHETKLEPIDLLAIVVEVSKTPLRTEAGEVDIVMPSETVMVMGNRTVLRQIISNIFLNAAEAIESQGCRGSIRVELSAEAEPAAAIKLAIADNGEGLAPEQLKTIFQRGVSTRPDRKGGLGLHWCANAITMLGGTIQAESQGPGQGATFVLRFVAAKSVIQEAA